MKKIVTIVGARPQFVKAAAVSRALAAYPGHFAEVIVHTGQHFDKNMSDIFFEEMNIPNPNYNLSINGLSHGAMTGQMLEGIEKIILNEKPDYVMVYGDTNSTIAGSLAAKKLHVKVIHIEAGLRSFNMRMPEEVNRILTDNISDFLFCPTETAIENLRNEGYDRKPCKIVLTGDVMEDAALFYKDVAEERSDILSRLNLSEEKFVLGTIHRAENTDDLNRLRSIISALNEINRTMTVVVPLHPRTSKILSANNITAEFTVIDPVGYFDMLQLITHCKIVLTDSGGLQKEAYFFDKYCITLRDETEWTELVKHGYNQLAGADAKAILDAFAKFSAMSFVKREQLYGGGTACARIVEALLEN